MTRLRSFFAFTFVLAAPHGTAHAADLAKVETFNSNGVKIAYFTEGKGVPVVLIHGWLSSAGINWALPGISGQLAKHHQVIALDVRATACRTNPRRKRSMAWSWWKT